MDELTRLYSPSCWVAGKSRDEVMNEFFEGIAKSLTDLEGDESVTRSLDVAYGSDERQKIDFWGDYQNSSNLLIFFHGGYWAAGTRKDCLTPALCCLSNDFAMASVGYGLATKPRSIVQSVNDAVKAVEFILKNYPSFESIVIGGHSAGAHLAVHVASKIKNEKIQGLLLYSGCYFLTELVDTEIGTDISLTATDAKSETCDISLLPSLPILIVLGLQESPKLVEQNRKLARHLKTSKLCEFEQESHYSIMTEMSTKTSEVYKCVDEFLTTFLL